MTDDRNRDQSRDHREEPFGQSGSGADYDPDANWAAERRRDGPSGGTPRGIEGAPSGAGDGGFGPEGDYRGAGGAPNADVIGQVNGDRDALAREARSLGNVRPDRATVGDNMEREPRDAHEPRRSREQGSE